MRKMKFIKANLNNYIRVKLSDSDKNRVKDHYNKYITDNFLKMTSKDIEKFYKGDGYYEFQHHEFITIFGENIILIEQSNVLIEVEDDSEGNRTTMGVGDGTGQLFVHGDHESIKVLQGKLLELEALRLFRDNIQKVMDKSNF